MGGDDGEPALSQMLADEVGEKRVSGGVEGGAGLVEQPERARGDEEAGQRQAPSLPGREIAASRSAMCLRPTRSSAAGTGRPVGPLRSAQKDRVSAVVRRGRMALRWPQ